MSWWTMGLYVAILFVSVFMHLFIEMPIATLWSYVMLEKWFKLILLTSFRVGETSYAVTCVTVEPVGYAFFLSFGYHP